MYNPFKFFREKISPSYLGVDIGTASIKIVEVEKGENKPRITNYAVLENQSALLRPSAVFQTSTLKIFEKDIIGFLNAAIKKMKPKSKNVIASLPGFSAFNMILDFPQMKPEEMKNAMSFKARQYIPLSISDVVLDWIKIGEYEDENGFKYTQMLLISVPKEQVEKYQNIFKSLNFNLIALEIESFSLVRSLVNKDSVPVFIIDIGSNSTDIIISDNGQLKFFSQTDYAGSSITHAISSSLGINPIRAEEIKKERGIISTERNYELSTVIMPVLDVIISEARKVLFEYKNKYKNARDPESIILSGGGANLPGIEKYFSKQMELPAVKASPFNRFEYSGELETVINELNPLMSIAMGLVLRKY